MQTILKSQASGAEQANKDDPERVPRQKRSHLIVLAAIELILGTLLFLPFWYAASAQVGTYGFEARLQADADRLLEAEAGAPQVRGGPNLAGPFQQGQATTLTVAILSSPWAPVDHNSPPDGPQVFVVEAQVTNTGPTTATNVSITLNYNGAGWSLLPGENPVRSICQLAPGQVFYAYWFASYPSAVPSSHSYAVSAGAANASQVAASGSVTTRDAQDVGQGAGNLRVLLVNTFGRGVGFDMTVVYELSDKFQEIIFSPVGNDNFKADAYRLLATQSRLYDDLGNTTTVADRLYFPALPSYAKYAEVTYSFVAIGAGPTQLCPYAAAGSKPGAKLKYAKDYCAGGNSILPPPVTFSMAKQASSAIIQQGQRLDYSIQYANTGSAIPSAQIIDDTPGPLASIIAGSIIPPASSVVGGRIVWDLSPIPAQSNGTLNYAVQVDGAGQDLVDGTLLVNQAYLNTGPLCCQSCQALRTSVTTTVRAPAIQVSKTDGRSTAGAGDLLTYTLRITNSGSVIATGLVITDVLPADVNYASAAAMPAETSRSGQILVWDNLGPILANGGSVVIRIPVTVGPLVPGGTTLLNTVHAKYENQAGWVYATKTATDTSTVSARTLTISKSDYPDPVLTGDLITYTVHVTNSSPAAATHVLVTDVVPLSTTYQTCRPKPCAMSNGVVSWTLSALPAGHHLLTFSVWVSDSLETGTLIHNQDYGISSDQSAYYPGLPVTTLVNRNAAFFEGYSYQDDDLDGVRDGGEMGLAGVPVTLASASVPLTTTDGSGAYHFRVESEGPISVTAAVPAGYFRTTHGTVFTHAILGITQTVDFGYAPLPSPLGAIYGTVFGDLDCDGVQGGEERGIPDVCLTLDQAISTTTDRYGGYTFSATVESIHSVVETDPDGYFSTTPNTVTLLVEEGHSYQVDFGDTTTTTCFAAIYGTVFNDADTDEMWDYLTEVGIPNVVITLTKSQMATTGPYGGYTLSPISASGSYTVTETDPDDYVSTTPNVVSRSVELGHGYPVNFGDVKSGPWPIYLPVILKNH
jgi:uncharacterized repeat protein (TIGR01451 family)